MENNKFAHYVPFYLQYFLFYAVRGHYFYKNIHR